MLTCIGKTVRGIHGVSPGEEKEGYTWGDSDVILFHIYANLVLPPSCR